MNEGCGYLFIDVKYKPLDSIIISLQKLPTILYPISQTKSFRYQIVIKISKLIVRLS